MEYLKKTLKNLGLLIIIGIVLLLIFPTQMSEAFNTLGGLFGPILILVLIATALPNKKSK